MAGAIVALVIFAAIIGGIAYLIYVSVNQRNVSIQLNDTLPWTPQESMPRLQAMATPLMQKWDYRVSTQGLTNVQFAYKYRPTWLVIPCILFFPLGLLSLLYSKTVEIAFNAFPSDNGGAEIMVVGQGSPYVKEQLEAFIRELSLHDKLPPSPEATEGGD